MNIKSYRETDTHIYFWGSYLSNFYWTPFTDGKDDIVWKTSEHYYMAMKAAEFGDYDSFDAIVLAPDAKSAKAIGRKVKGFGAERWDKVSEEYMFTACMHKFLNNEHIRKELIETGNKILVEASPVDKVWGVGLHATNDLILDEKNWKGENRLGKVLMRVREVYEGVTI